MNANLARLIKAFDQLSASDQKEFHDTVRKIELSSATGKSLIMESLSTTINFSPAPGSCPACGR